MSDQIFILEASATFSNYGGKRQTMKYVKMTKMYEGPCIMKHSRPQSRLFHVMINTL